MTYTEAKRELKRVGCAHASGDALRAMYAGLIPLHCCVGKCVEPNFYRYLQGFAGDNDITEAARAILREPLKIWDIGVI